MKRRDSRSSRNSEKAAVETRAAHSLPLANQVLLLHGSPSRNTFRFEAGMTGDGKRVAHVLFMD